MLDIFEKKQKSVNNNFLTISFFVEKNMHLNMNTKAKDIIKIFTFLALIININIASIHFDTVSCDAPKSWNMYLHNDTNFFHYSVSLLF